MQYCYLQHWSLLSQQDTPQLSIVSTLAQFFLKLFFCSLNFILLFSNMVNIYRFKTHKLSSLWPTITFLEGKMVWKPKSLRTTDLGKYIFVNPHFY